MKFSTVFAAALSLGTALALPAGQHKAIEKKTDDVQGPIKSVLATVDDLKVTVHTEIETIGMSTHHYSPEGQAHAHTPCTAATITSGDVNDVVPVVKASLETIITEISGVVDGVVPLVLGIAGPISEGDLQIVLEIVTDVKDIVGDVQHEVTELVDVLGAGELTQDAFSIRESPAD